MVWRRALLFAGLLALASALPAAAQPMRLDGWWIVLASVKDDGTQAPHRRIDTIRKAMRPCGADILSDNSTKFVGFAPGYVVAALGAFRTEAEARGRLLKLSACAPGAYVKKARHTGE